MKTFLKDRSGKNLSLSEVISKVLVRFYNYFLDFQLMLARWVGYLPFNKLRWLFYRLLGLKLPWHSNIHMFAQFFQLNNIYIGKDTIIGQRAFLDGRDRLTIGSHTDIASEVMIYNSHHNIDSKDFEAITKPVKIGNYVFIGPRAIILPGVNIEDGAVVAAGAVVTHDVKSGEVVAGVPAKFIRKRKTQNWQYRLGRPRLFQ